MVNSFMKKQYLIPATNAQTICHLNAICVGSVHGTEDLNYGGAADSSNPEQQPF